MKYCRKCGSPLGGNEKFCRKCGTSIPIMDPTYKTEKNSRDIQQNSYDAGSMGQQVITQGQTASIKGKKSGLIVAIIAVATLLIGAAIVFFALSGSGINPFDYVTANFEGEEGEISAIFTLDADGFAEAILKASDGKASKLQVEASVVSYQVAVASCSKTDCFSGDTIEVSLESEHMALEELFKQWGVNISPLTKTYTISVKSGEAGKAHNSTDEKDANGNSINGGTNKNNMTKKTDYKSESDYYGTWVGNLDSVIVLKENGECIYGEPIKSNNLRTGVNCRWSFSGNQMRITGAFEYDIYAEVRGENYFTILADSAEWHNETFVHNPQISGYGSVRPLRRLLDCLGLSGSDMSNVQKQIESLAYNNEKLKMNVKNQDGTYSQIYSSDIYCVTVTTYHEAYLLQDDESQKYTLLIPVILDMEFYGRDARLFAMATIEDVHSKGGNCEFSHANISQLYGSIYVMLENETYDYLSRNTIEKVALPFGEEIDYSSGVGTLN